MACIILTLAFAVAGQPLQQIRQLAGGYGFRGICAVPILPVALTFWGPATRTVHLANMPSPHGWTAKHMRTKWQ